MTGIEIRPAELKDEAAWRRLWAGYLSFYKVQLDQQVTDFTWARILDPACPVNMRVALRDGEIAAFAIHHFHASTWVISPDCYLEDLYVDEAWRGGGTGRALIDDLVALCRTNGWERLYWHTDENNARARALYDTYVKSDGHVRYRMKIS